MILLGWDIRQWTYVLGWLARTEGVTVPNTLEGALTARLKWRTAYRHDPLTSAITIANPIDTEDIHRSADLFSGCSRYLSPSPPAAEKRS